MTTLREAALRRGVRGALLDALEGVAPGLFLSDGEPGWVDLPAAIGLGHHRAEPSILARMLQLAGAGPGRRLVVLGAGTGYTCALAARVGCVVTGVERVPALAERARGLGLDVAEGDVFRWVPDGRYDAVVVCGAIDGPGSWLDAVAPGGALVAPVGDERHQELVCFEIDDDGEVRRRAHGRVRFERLIRQTIAR